MWLETKPFLRIRCRADVVEEVVDEGQQFRNGSKAVSNGAANVAVRTQSSNLRGCRSEHRDICVAKAIDRLLPVTNDKDARRKHRCLAQATPLTPGLDKERDQLPLCPTGVLELINEHVVVARLKSVARSSELVHLTE